ncbi:GTP 3',8-cyclase MoaA [Halarcobacter mediterraneus]|uniref:GTP 3',8-cyclase n=1 Tax=Halarcobacter mediterraneus TaxID=2023153 RepID=A0A4Q1AYQ5_9BACT|nr:GTP 3',8-cyclase MoaA [Halarcobacter mediterraneus]RXK12790.1 GTP 3',8-cyclase MoaA [Halarcobacter mediterraneus]
MLIDKYDRVIDYIRVSVTQRCNFRCQYCMPEKPFEWTPKEELLSYEEIFKFLKVAIDEGIKKIRITGGEPLVRDDLYKLIEKISSYKDDIDIALTTNGYLLSSQIKKLKEAGLKRVNISIDSLNEDTFSYLTKKRLLSKVKDGIEAALEQNIEVKLNTVVIKGINDDEILDLYEYSKKRGIQIRFIEYMQNKWANEKLKTLSGKNILEQIAKKYPIEELEMKKSSAAKLYKDNTGFIFGIIEPYDDSFCSTCNRIRLSAQGDLIPCLYYEDSINIKESLDSDEKLLNTLNEVIENRPEKNLWNHNSTDMENISSREFYYTGG